MATRHPTREGTDTRNPQNHRNNDRNRTFSSTTTNHYKNKLAQIGIQKDLREILERKKIDKEQAENRQNVSGKDVNGSDQTSRRKVRFDEKPMQIRRSKSFTSGVTKHPVEPSPSYQTDRCNRERNSNQSHWKNEKSQKVNFVDLHNPKNIKIEIETDSGTRKCIVDVDTPISGVKCDLKSSRNILKYAENKPKVNPETEISEHRNERKQSHAGSRAGQRRSFHKKRNENNQSTPENHVGQSNCEDLQEKIDISVK